MFGFFKKGLAWGISYGVILISFSIFVMLDTFVIAKSEQQIETKVTENTSEITESTEKEVTDTTYKDENIEISIETKRSNGTTYYVADIQLSDSSLLKTAFANNSYGRNIKAKTSEIAEENNAILALNGDFYGFRDTGYVLRNGVTYRETTREAGDDDALVIDADGNFSIIQENETALSTLESQGVMQVISFGPSLVENGSVTVTSKDEVGKSMTSNPRTAIGQVGELHYKVVVSDGRTSESEGFSLLELAEILKEEGCTTAYNLDGGGSSSLVFMGTVINKPTTNGKTISEREVSDIVYFGY